MKKHTHKHNQYHSPSDKANICRVCNHYLEEGEPRCNDYFMFKYETEIDQPICNFCSHNNPDELHRRYLNSSMVRKITQSL